MAHPCEGMSKAAIAAFEAIAINLKPCCSQRVLDRLLDAGLIAKQERSSQGPGYYYVPLPIHIRYCEWNSERYRDQDPE